MSQPAKKHLAVFTVRASEKAGEQGFWCRIGTAFPNDKDEGFTVLLDALPLDGRLVVRPPKKESAIPESPSTGA